MLIYRGARGEKEPKSVEKCDKVQRNVANMSLSRLTAGSLWSLEFQPSGAERLSVNGYSHTCVQRGLYLNTPSTLYMYSGAYSVYTSTVPIAHPTPNAHKHTVSIKGMYNHSSRIICSKVIVFAH